MKFYIKSSLESPYLYIFKHGIGPGTLPKDVEIVKTKDLPNGYTAVWLKRFLNTSELKQYDIPSETRINELLDRIGYCQKNGDVVPCDRVVASEICYRDRDNDDRVVALDVGMSDEDVEEMLAAHPSYYRSTLDRFDDIDACGSVMASKQPKWWDSQFTCKVIDAYKDGKLTTENIDEWEQEYADKYNFGKNPGNFGTKSILNYYIETGKDPRDKVESCDKITASWKDDEEPYGFDSRNFNDYDADDWAYYLATKWRFSYDDYEELLHDLRNLRGSEWLRDAEKRLKRLKCYDEFKEFVGSVDDEDEDIESCDRITASKDISPYEKYADALAKQGYSKNKFLKSLKEDFTDKDLEDLVNDKADLHAYIAGFILNSTGKHDYEAQEEATKLADEIISDACDKVTAAMEFYIDQGAGLGEPGKKFTEDELKELYYHLCIHEGDEICNSYPSFEAWLDDSLASGLIRVDFIEDDLDYPYTLTDDEFDVESEYFDDIESCDKITASQKHHPLIPEGWESIPEGEDDEGNWGTIAKELPNNDGYIWIDMYQDEAGKTFYHIDISYRTSEGRMGDVHPLTSKEFRSLKQALDFVEAKIARMYKSEEDVEACDKVIASTHRYSAGRIEEDGTEDFYYDTGFDSYDEAFDWGTNHDCTHIYDREKDEFIPINSCDTKYFANMVSASDDSYRYLIRGYYDQSRRGLAEDSWADTISEVDEIVNEYANKGYYLEVRNLETGTVLEFSADNWFDEIYPDGGFSAIPGAID